MALLELQQVLARLYTDAALLEGFLAEPQASCERLQVSEPVRNQLLVLSASELRFFADSLRQKRYLMVCKLLPRSKALLAEAFKAEFMSYAQAPLPQGSKKHQLDAVAFANYLLASLKSSEDSWLRDQLLFEKICLQTQLQERGCFCQIFRHAIWANSSKPLTSLGFWLRLPGWAGWWHLRLPLPGS